MTTAEKIMKASNQTDSPFSSTTGGLLTAEQSTEFMRMAFDSTAFMNLVRHEMRISPKGEIDKLGVGGRLIQKKTEGAAGTNRSVKPTKVDYACTDITLPWSVSEKLIRENIERGRITETIIALMSASYGVDLMDLGFNGDTENADSDADTKAFLTICDGWLKKMTTTAGAHVLTDQTWGLDFWYNMAAAMPSKYKSSELRWVCSPNTKLAWRKFCENKALAGGTGRDLYDSSAPCGYQIEEVSKMDDGTVILTNPKNLIVVSTYDMVLRQTNDGKDAVQNDERYFAIHGNVDYIVEEMDAVSKVTGLTIS